MILNKPRLILMLIAGLSALGAYAQTQDTSAERYSFHAQTTVINQFKPAFSAPYSGANSLQTQRDNQVSLTSTLYLGARLWKNASFYVNPEIAGGSGLSSALGVAASTNGETFRVGSTAPKLYLARMFFKQLIALDKNTAEIDGDQNQLKVKQPTKYFGFTFGKISLADFFDKNDYSHDPRTQFISWGLMDNGAWDYAANTRGYTPSVVLEYVNPKNEFRYAMALLPLTANANNMNYNLSQARSQTVEYVRNLKYKNRAGSIRFLAFLNNANMGNYQQSIETKDTTPSIISNRKFGRSKMGFGVSFSQAISDNAGAFFRASWNDGKNETWAFTEIDRSMSAGYSVKGIKWKRENDVLGIACVVSGISKEHRDYLKYGGRGFMLGDGNLKYGLEKVGEIYYAIALIPKQLTVTGFYQLVVNPGYNADRKGPVSVLSVRVHVGI